jgi:uncharacterized protein (TIGR03089 family)
VRADHHRPSTIPAALAAATTDPARPLLTWYDDATGERTELSGATLANWLAKTANLLVDGCGLDGGENAVVDLPPHWQTGAVLLGCWSAGACVAPPGEGAAAAEVVFATADRAAGYAGSGAEVFTLGLTPLATPLAEVPPGTSDYVASVRVHGDFFTRPVPIEPDHPATPAASHAELCRAAADRATELGISPGARVLVDLAVHPQPLDWLLAPLLAAGSMVLCRNLDQHRLADRITTERVTTALTGA